MTLRQAFSPIRQMFESLNARLKKSLDMPQPVETPSFPSAIPFWISFGLVPFAWIAAMNGGLWLLALPFLAWFLSTAIDKVLGRSAREFDPNTDESVLFWYNLATWLWVPVQAITLLGILYLATRSEHLSAIELLVLFFGVGILTGTIGITYAHELMHRGSRWERFLADLLLAMVLYSHFRSEHLLVHHPHVGTPRDAISAPYNRGFYRHFVAVLPGCLRSAWQAERQRLKRAGRSVLDRRNPFWRYLALQSAVLIVAWVIGGWIGVLLLVWQAFVAVWQLELTNYIEHYGLSRQKLENGRYEPVKAHHSWNATHTFTNWLLINLQRHADHHVAPGRPYPLLKPHSAEVAPELPFGYPLMAAIAMVPPFWRRMMNPRVRQWRRQFYPDITEWPRAES